MPGRVGSRSGRLASRSKVGSDQVIEVGWFPFEPNAGVAATCKFANFQSDRGGVVALTHLDAGAVLAPLKRAIALAAAPRPDRSRSQLELARLRVHRLVQRRPPARKLRRHPAARVRAEAPR